MIGLFLSACTTVPETGRSQLILLGPQEEVRQGYLAFQHLKRQLPIAQNPSQTQRVRRIGQRILAVAPVPKTDWEFVVFEDDEPNAFALPGGKIGVHTGLFRVATDDGMVATVLAHEVAHVVARHGAERFSQGLLASLAGAALEIGLAAGTDLTPAQRNTFLSAYGAGATLGIILPYSRTMEYEADRLGLLYMARAGYDPRDALRFWKAMIAYGQRSGQNNQFPAFLRTHPMDQDRLAQLVEFMPVAMQEYRKAQARL